MQYLYNDHISGVKIEVQKLYSIKVISISIRISIRIGTSITIIISIITILIIFLIVMIFLIISINTMTFRKRSWTG